MKILHLIYTEAVAGAEKYLLNLLPGLKNYNIECHLICVCPNPDDPILISYCEKMNTGGVKATLIAGRKINFLSVSKAINSYLNNRGISVVHSHLSNADLLAVLTKIIYNKKIFIISSKHGYDERYLVKYAAETKNHIIDRNVYYYFTRFLLKYIDINLAASKGIAELYYNIKLTSKAYHYIHHGIYLVKSEAKSENLKKSTFQLIIVGRLEKVKGHKYLFEALIKVVEKVSDVQLLILGDGSEKNNLLELAKNNGIETHIEFLGYQPNPYNYISSSDIIVQPSLFESFGLVYIEAFALSIPVVAFDVPAANEIIINNETGILVQKFNSELLAKKIIYLLQNQNERIRISKNANQAFLDNFTADKMIEKTANWYKSLSIYTE